MRVDSDVVSSVLSEIDTYDGNVEKTNITQGKIQKYLRMTIDYSTLSKVKPYMIDYIGKILENTPDRGISNTVQTIPL